MATVTRYASFGRHYGKGNKGDREPTNSLRVVILDKEETCVSVEIVVLNIFYDISFRLYDLYCILLYYSHSHNILLHYIYIVLLYSICIVLRHAPCALCSTTTSQQRRKKPTPTTPNPPITSTPAKLRICSLLKTPLTYKRIKLLRQPKQTYLLQPALSPTPPFQNIHIITLAAFSNKSIHSRASLSPSDITSKIAQPQHGRSRNSFQPASKSGEQSAKDAGDHARNRRESKGDG